MQAYVGENQFVKKLQYICADISWSYMSAADVAPDKFTEAVVSIIATYLNSKSYKPL